MIDHLAPIIPPTCRVLILGSYPSRESLKYQQYYANPRNMFWKIISSLLKFPEDIPYEQKITILQERGIGLWDVIRICKRSGSRDASITDPIFNDFSDIFIKYPDIKAIFCNGKKSWDLWGRNIVRSQIRSPFLPTVNMAYLPSSSPAYTLSLSKKIILWSTIVQYLVSPTKPL
jgi:double-stranded uracil-DNA glycosylase